jgi:hypothetical protein
MDVLDGRSAVTSVIGLSWLVLEIDESGYRRRQIKRWFPSAEISLLLGPVGLRDHAPVDILSLCFPWYRQEFSC